MIFFVVNKAVKLMKSLKNLTFSYKKKESKLRPFEIVGKNEIWFYTISEILSQNGKFNILLLNKEHLL